MSQADSGQFSRAYTAILFSYGCLSLLLAWGLSAAFPSLEREAQASLTLNVNIHILLGIAAIVIGLLRLLKGVASLPASNALSFALAMDLPIGTAVFLFWLIRVRHGERPLLLQSGPKPVRWYTAGLFLAALGFS
jgi:hypothetical protein